MKSNINYWIEKRGYKKKWVAAQLGVSQNVFSRWVNDGGKPSLEKAFELADLLECNVDDLYVRTKKAPPK
ncbi:MULTISPECIES: helix-turn-helix transcriptional regulator [Pontibacillus]|uniref:Helix-turn-helix transcriptional regulator n=1 Tax=Pontibacillus chungwhensis TaxID=265426 RepID=A0ABY8UZF7_9BACI|nr:MULTISPECIES: helix-turn-helix transcriptional regulator [Pontibacillus]MCD5324804.1 helix-turn-helix domain-containing protein [Pontibacillus sp. HN14]WIF98763.1 helix-turn-helix transcriptional regulator [Pontibacillus chungwhensis]